MVAHAVLVVSLVLVVGCVEEAPTIVDLTKLKNTTSTIGPYQVTATVVDALRVKRVELHYRVRPKGDVGVKMTEIAPNVFQGAIPGQPVGSVIDYCIVATTESGDGTKQAFDPAKCVEAPYSFTIVPPA